MSAKHHLFYSLTKIAQSEYNVKFILDFQRFDTTI